jgi:hypothetical protein
MQHIKFEKNWGSGYHEEVKNVQMLTHHIFITVWPRPAGKTVTPRILHFTILIQAFLLYITMHSVFFSTCTDVEKTIFEN